MNPTMLEWCFAREVLRRLGFSAEEIYFACSKAGSVITDTGDTLQFDHPVIAVEIRRGDLTFVWTIGPIEIPYDKVQAAYEAACDAWNAGTAASMDEFHASGPFQQAVGLMLALQRKGISHGHLGDLN